MNANTTKYSLKFITVLLKDSFKELIKNDPLRMAGATAFFTTFALPPILIIIIQALGLIYDPNKISSQLFQKLAGIIGRRSVQQVISILTVIREKSENWLITIGGFIFLLFVATTLFKVIKSSLNQLWRIRVNKKVSLWVTLRTRIVSVVIILVAGILFVVGFLAEGVQAFMGQYLADISPTLASYFNSTLNYLLSIIIVTAWFAVVFRYLPDGRQEWKVVLTGAFFTSLLFNVGKLAIRWLLYKSSISSIYGASGSIVILLLFVFYSSLILYFGAAFTKVWAARHNKPVKLLSHAVHYQLAEVNE